ncbi:MFS transporter [Methylobacterium nodulans]|uniref:Major facilitator superfamily MFS_1 n=1 Tax=Methylobacterium nodulans (strain LMG 21967 / CNCM I-2342 / ORS 2060) TaxID=460265 RepID=B8IEP7_METNO|nr:MFS transporter [Methylobacterium nodulans]ACL61390.1 major facilitator superfamily MFS_1 [Methylobacterium nodulans ORS 2060]
MIATPPDIRSPLDSAFRLTRRRLVPFLLLMYVLAFLDRANIGFAKQAFQASAGISDAAYALGAGLFFLTYALFEVPSNLIMHRVGARLWMARIMVTWGLISAAMMFTSGELSFYALRLLLGAAEAGFFPGVILYLTYWFPQRTRGQIMGLFYFGAPIAFIFGSPLSGLLLELDGMGGLHGWQWMFMVEGLLASVVGVWAYFYLDDKPADARWLPAAEKQALSAAIAQEEKLKTAHGHSGVAALLAKPRMLHFLAIYFLIQMSVYGVIFYLPSQVAALLGKKVGLEVGLVTAIPWICALIAAYLLPRLADREGNHRTLGAMTLAVSGLGIAISAGSAPLTALAALCFAAAGFIAVQPLFWTFPTGYLGGVAAAGGIALINALGALGGFVAPNVKAWADLSFGSPQAGLYVLACTTLLGAALILGLSRSTPVAAAPVTSKS